MRWLELNLGQPHVHLTCCAIAQAQHFLLFSPFPSWRVSCLREKVLSLRYKPMFVSQSCIRWDTNRCLYLRAVLGDFEKSWFHWPYFLTLQKTHVSLPEGQISPQRNAFRHTWGLTEANGDKEILLGASSELKIQEHMPCIYETSSLPPH